GDRSRLLGTPPARDGALRGRRRRAVAGPLPRAPGGGAGPHPHELRPRRLARAHGPDDAAPPHRLRGRRAPGPRSRPPLAGRRARRLARLLRSPAPPARAAADLPLRAPALLAGAGAADSPRRGGSPGGDLSRRSLGGA